MIMFPSAVVPKVISLSTYTLCAFPTNFLVFMISKRKTSKCQNLFHKLNFPELPKYSWNLPMISIIGEFINSKIFSFENSWKITTALGRKIWKISISFGTLAWQFEILTRFWHVGMPSWKFTSLWHVGTFICTLARWHVKVRSWHAFGTLVHGHVDHVDTHDTHNTRFIKLVSKYTYFNYRW